MGTRVAALKDTIFRHLDLLLRCSELELVENNIPIHFIEEVLEFQTVERSEHIYDYLESRVERLTVVRKNTCMINKRSLFVAPIHWDDPSNI